MTRLYLIRHAEAAGNIQRVFQGHVDAQVSDNGRRQLRLLAERCKKLIFDAVYSSPLIRAYETAQAANYYHGLPVTRLDGLKEINGGVWEGLPWAELPGLYPKENRLWVEEPWNFVISGGENMRDVYERMRETVLKIVCENIGKSVCVVSHGCAIRNFLCWARGLPVEKLNQIAWCDNTALSMIDFDEELKPEILLLNDASHLDGETSTLAKQDWWKEFDALRTDEDGKKESEGEGREHEDHGC